MSFDKRWLTALMCCIWLNAACPETGLTAAPTVDQVRSMHTIQVGSHRDRDAAQREAKRIRSFDLQVLVFTRHEAVEGKGMWYRIYVGLFSTRAAALDVAEDLKKRKIVSSYWLKTIAPPFPEPAESQAVEEKPIAPEEKEIKKAPAAAPPPKTEAPGATPTQPPPPPAPKPQEVKPRQAPPTTAKPMESPPVADRKPETPATQKAKPKTNFSLGFKAGALSVGSIDRIDISGPGGETRSYDFSGTYTPVGLILSYQLKERFLLRGSIEKAMGASVDYYQYTLDAGVLFNPLGPVKPYASVGLIYGDLKWDEFIGDFDSGLGWKIGLGGFYPLGNFQLGAEVSYQAIDYSYNLPQGWSVTSGAESVNFSGLSISAMLMYRF